MNLRRSLRQAFTLLEVAVSIGIVAIGILTMALFLPIALRAQQQARFQLYAGTMAMELIERFMATQTANDYHPEANAPWDTPSGYRSMSPDLEIKASTINAGFIPLPRVIAYRLDSPNDEIRRLLDRGGNIYYANPRIVAVGARDGTTAKPAPPVDAQRLIIGIVGDAQQNALPTLPMKAWPYRVPYPSQPHGFVASENGDTHYATCSEQGMALDDDMWELLHHDFKNGASDWDGAAGSPATPFEQLTSGSGYLATSGYTQGPLFGWGQQNLQRPLIDAARTGGHSRIPGWVTAKGYVALAVWYAQRKGLPTSFLVGNPTRQEIDAAAQQPAHVYALRFLAHAGMCLTKHYSLEAQARREEVLNLPGFSQDSVPFNPDHAFIVNLLRTPAHPGLRLGIPIPGDDRWNPADPASVNNIPNEPVMVLGRVGVPSPFSLQELWNLGTPLAGTVVNPALLNWATVNASHPFRQSGDPDYDATGARWGGHFFVTHAMVVNWAETSLAVAMQHATINPYDWGAPRPLNRPLFTDHPLIQWDLFPTAAKPQASGVIYGTNNDQNIPLSDPSTPDYQYTNGVLAKQWRPVAARSITNGMPGPTANGTIGRNGDTGIRALPASSLVDWNAIEGTPAHFNLTNRFSAAERCREIVVWTADWMSYVDCETASSAAVDASRYPRQRPASGDRLNTSWSRERSFTQSFMGPDFQWGNTVPGGSGGDFAVVTNFSDVLQTSFRNPELALLFYKDMNNADGSPAVPTYHDVFPWTIGPQLYHDRGGNSEPLWLKARYNLTLDGTNWMAPDYGYSPVQGKGTYRSNMQGQDPRPIPPLADPKKVFSGIYGADRNINNVLDRGPLPRSTRIRAVEVMRFTYYDPRLVMSLR